MLAWAALPAAALVALPSLRPLSPRARRRSAGGVVTGGLRSARQLPGGTSDAGNHICCSLPPRGSQPWASGPGRAGGGASSLQDAAAPGEVLPSELWLYFYLLPFLPLINLSQASPETKITVSVAFNRNHSSQLARQGSAAGREAASSHGPCSSGSSPWTGATSKGRCQLTHSQIHVVPLAQRSQPVQAPALIVVLEELHEACEESARAVSRRPGIGPGPQHEPGSGTTLPVPAPGSGEEAGETQGRRGLHAAAAGSQRWQSGAGMLSARGQPGPSPRGGTYSGTWRRRGTDS